MRLRHFSCLLLLLCASAAMAQKTGRFEFSPFVGWQSSGSYPVQSATTTPGSTFIPTTSSSTIDRLRVDSSLAYGAFVDYSIIQSLQLEALWAHNPTTYSQHDSSTGQYSKIFDSAVDQVEFGVLVPFGTGGLYGDEKKLQPFIAGGLGFTHESNNNGNPNRTAFAFNVGGGVKGYLSKNFGLRADVRYMPTYANSTPGFSCDIFGNCFSTPQRNFQNRVMVTGGVIFRF